MWSPSARFEPRCPRPTSRALAEETLRGSRSLVRASARRGAEAERARQHPGKVLATMCWNELPRSRVPLGVNGGKTVHVSDLSTKESGGLAFLQERGLVARVVWAQGQGASWVGVSWRRPARLAGIGGRGRNGRRQWVGLVPAARAATQRRRSSPGACRAGGGLHRGRCRRRDLGPRDPHRLTGVKPRPSARRQDSSVGSEGGGSRTSAPAPWKSAGCDVLELFTPTHPLCLMGVKPSDVSCNDRVGRCLEAKFQPSADFFHVGGRFSTKAAVASR